MAKVLPGHIQTFRGRKVVGFIQEPQFERLAWIIDEYQVDSVIEVGSFVGLSTCFFAERVGSVVAVDTFNAASAADPTLDPFVRSYHRDAYRNQYFTFLQNTIAYPNIRGIRLPSLEAAKLDIEADMVYIDASHTYEAAKADIEAWLPHARKVIAGDDNLDTSKKRSHYGVQRAMAELGIPDSGERTWWKPL